MRRIKDLTAHAVATYIVGGHQVTILQGDQTGCYYALEGMRYLLMSFDGCVAAGDTVDEALTEATEALERERRYAEGTW